MNRTPVQLGLRCGLILGLIGLMHLLFSTMTPMPRRTWGLMQTFYGVATIFFAGWAGLKSYAATKRLMASALAGGLAGVLGVGLFSAGLLVVAYGLTERLVQFPFAAVDLSLPGSQSIAAYLHSEKGWKDLWTSSLGSLFAMAPMAAGFGAVGGLVTRSVEDVKEQGS